MFPALLNSLSDGTVEHGAARCIFEQVIQAQAKETSYFLATIFANCFTIICGRNGEKVPNRTFLGSHFYCFANHKRMINFRSIKISIMFIKN